MKRGDWFYLLAGIVLAFFIAQSYFPSVEAFTLQRGGVSPNSNSDPGDCSPFAHWRLSRFIDGKIPYKINQDGSDNLTLTEAMIGIEQAFSLWRNVPGTGLDFRFDGTTPIKSFNYQDGVNIIFWDEAGDNFSDDGNRYAAVTRTFFNLANGEILGADIALNGAYSRWNSYCVRSIRSTTITWSLTQEGCSGIIRRTLHAKVQSFVGHEIGHFIGLGHSAVEGTVMFERPISGAVPSILHSDDIAGAQYIYPFARSGFCTSNSVWAMSGGNAQRSGRSPFAAPSSIPTDNRWVLSTSSGTPIVGDIVVSSEGNIYFASNGLYALTPSGIPYVPFVSSPTVLRTPALDDINGFIYFVVSSAKGGWDLVRYNKQLQNPIVIFHGNFPFGSYFPTDPLVASDGTVYLSDGISIIARGVQNWITSVTGCRGIVGQSLGTDGFLYAICDAGGAGSGSGLYKFNATSGDQVGFAPLDNGGVTPVIDKDNNIISGFIRFTGIQYFGGFRRWTNNLQVLEIDESFNLSSFTSFRPALLADGRSTVRISAAFQNDRTVSYRGFLSNTLDRIRWDAALLPPAYYTSIPASDAVGKIYVGATNSLKCLNATDGTLIWSLPTAGAVTTQPVISREGVVYVGTDTGKIYAF
jgi:hypothetical protein